MFSSRSAFTKRTQFKPVSWAEKCMFYSNSFCLCLSKKLNMAVNLYFLWFITVSTPAHEKKGRSISLHNSNRCAPIKSATRNMEIDDAKWLKVRELLRKLHTLVRFTSINLRKNFVHQFSILHYADIFERKLSNWCNFKAAQTTVWESFYARLMYSNFTRMHWS